MDSRQARTMAAFQHALIYLQQHPIKPEPRLLPRMRAELEESITTLHRLSGERAAANTSGRRDRMLRITALRREMMALVRIARPLLRFAPDAEVALKVPHARADTATVAGAVVQMAEMLAPHADLLEDAGYGRNFLKEFRAEGQLLVASMAHVEEVRARSARITTEAKEAIAKGQKALSVIEGLVMKQANGDPVVLKHWRNRRRVPKKAGRPKGKRRG